MSNSPTNSPSPSNSQTERSSSEVPVTLPQQVPTTSTSQSEETPQPTAGPHSRSTPPILVLDRRSITSNPRTIPPLVLIHDPRTARATSASPADSSDPRQGRPLQVARHLPRTSSSHSPRRVFHPYTRPSSTSRAQSQPHSPTMSAPNNTSSGSNPPQLPYAPFPYPAPANAGQGGKGGSGK
ncbi:hypothetical protein BU23DRAFT_574860 [Bimuria novae-zelandiae CBS 107.79]|uniref:Uncharacterized protein n=1 Tax=Bimuria novae-zelandiae CBS 107.79 TaxID=1447943 RepID=A0A6A5UWK1_9PLEO|nr:hypothetical protein BU23DRAFT_574860 [Bimuria novae-zelandiae CBS 107.79]